MSYGSSISTASVKGNSPWTNFWIINQHAHKDILVEIVNTHSRMGNLVDTVACILWSICISLLAFCKPSKMMIAGDCWTHMGKNLI